MYYYSVRLNGHLWNIYTEGLKFKKDKNALEIKWLVEYCPLEDAPEEEEDG